MYIHVEYMCFCLTWSLVYSGAIKPLTDLEVMCNDVPERTLSEILGPAYNSRYMSIQKPDDEEEPSDGVNYKRDAVGAPSFYVEDTFEQVLDDKPAWVSSNHFALENPHLYENTRRKRATSETFDRQWDCESKISWIDLGPDYFPRYLRSVECLAKSCWYGHYKCRPRSFTVKILRRRKDVCTVVKPGTKIGVAGLPEELRVMWVWEERAVNFCCDCGQ